MQPRKKHLSTLMLSLCIVTGSFIPGNASASHPEAMDTQSQRGKDKQAVEHTSDTACYPKAQGLVVTPTPRRYPRSAHLEKLAHLPVLRPLNQAAASQPLALMPTAELTLARGMTFRKLLRRRTLG